MDKTSNMVEEQIVKALEECDKNIEDNNIVNIISPIGKLQSVLEVSKEIAPEVYKNWGKADIVMFLLSFKDSVIKECKK